MRAFLAVLMSCAVAAALVFVSPLVDSARAEMLVFGRGADSLTLDPARATDNESIKVIENLFDGLVRRKADSTEVEPCLATSWNASDDGLEWTFHLREGVRFHDGEPFDAHSVTTNFRRQYDPEHELYRDDFPYARAIFHVVESVRALERNIVRVRLNRPYAPFLANMAMAAAAIASPKALRRHGDDFQSHPVGAGAFVFQSWKRGEAIVLRRNEQYWDGRSALEGLVFRSIKDNNLRLREFRAGRIHIMDGLDPGDAPMARKIPGARLLTRSGANTGYLCMNTSRAPFNDVRARLAVAHAINKPRLVRYLYQGLAKPAPIITPPAIWGRNEALRGHAFDPALSRRLLAEAGRPDGFDVELWAMNAPRPYMPRPIETARVLAASLAAVNIRARIECMEWGPYLQKLRRGEHDMALMGWMSDNGDPDNFLYPLFSSSAAVRGKATNMSFFRHPGVNHLLSKAQRTIDTQERVALYRRVQTLIHNETPVAPLVHAPHMALVAAGLEGVVLDSLGNIRLDAARFAQ